MSESTEILPDIRNSVRALIIRDEKVLVLQKRDQRGDFLALPGGGQEVGEGLLDALQRECREELGTDVLLPRLFYVADHLRPRAAEPSCVRHLVEFIFLCQVAEDYIPQSGPAPDTHQIGVAWVECAELRAFPFLPQKVVTQLCQGIMDPQSTYLGIV